MKYLILWSLFGMGSSVHAEVTLPDLICKKLTESNGHGGPFSHQQTVTFEFSKYRENPYGKIITVENRDNSLGTIEKNEYSLSALQPTELDRVVFVAGLKRDENGNAGSFSGYIVQMKDGLYRLKYIQKNPHWGDADTTLKCSQKEGEI